MVRVLVVDDDASTMNLVGRMLEALGLRVDLADSGMEAQRLARRHRYALVLTDYQMPEVDGCALAAWIKARWAETMVFIMTGRSPAEVAEHQRGDTVDHWMFKPFNLRQLRERLADHGLSVQDSRTSTA